MSSNGLYTTDDKGEIRISGVTGTIVAKEVKPAPGYVIDQSTQTQTVTVNPMDTQTLTFLNEPLCSLTITKKDSVTGKPVPGTEFTVKDGNGTSAGPLHHRQGWDCDRHRPRAWQYNRGCGNQSPQRLRSQQHTPDHYVKNGSNP